MNVKNMEDALNSSDTKIGNMENCRNHRGITLFNVAY